jgi:hypothetical protein
LTAYLSIIRPRRAQVGEFLHLGARLEHPVESRDAGVHHALRDVAGHLLGANQDALDLGVVDARVVGPRRHVDLIAGVREQFHRGVLEAALRDPEAQNAFARRHQPP